jgi:hypothetical protein
VHGEARRSVVWQANIQARKFSKLYFHDQH